MVGCRFADGGPAWEEAPVIHSVALGGPGCRAVPGGSIKTGGRPAVMVEARHRSELALACTSRPGGERKLGDEEQWHEDARGDGEKGEGVVAHHPVLVLNVVMAAGCSQSVGKQAA